MQKYKLSNKLWLKLKINKHAASKNGSLRPKIYSYFQEKQTMMYLHLNSYCWQIFSHDATVLGYTKFQTMMHYMMHHLSINLGLGIPHIY